VSPQRGVTRPPRCSGHGDGDHQVAPSQATLLDIARLVLDESLAKGAIARGASHVAAHDVRDVAIRQCRNWSVVDGVRFWRSVCSPSLRWPRAAPSRQSASTPVRRRKVE